MKSLSRAPVLAARASPARAVRNFDAMAFLIAPLLPRRTASFLPRTSSYCSPQEPTARLRDHKGARPPPPSDDGSLPPLLPPFRPATPEAELAPHVARVAGRERAGREAQAAKRVTAVSSTAMGTLFAEVVQGGLPHGNVWLRPLMLKGPKGGWRDLRQTSDCLLPESLLQDAISPETRTALKLHLIAAESDLMDRLVNDEREAENVTFRKILTDFVDSLCTDDD